MAIYAIADLHLALGVPEKSMEFFGKPWDKYIEKMAAAWTQTVKADDLVLLPGDISWAKEKKDVVPDLTWIDALPGTKVLLRGNHDYWWTSQSQVKKILPPSLHIIQNNIFIWNEIAIGGSRLWDTDEFTFDSCIDYVPNPRANKMEVYQEPEEQERIFVRELARLELSLNQLPKNAKLKIAMTHYPPVGHPLKSSRASLLLEKYGVNLCVFGHLHNVKKELSLFGELHGIRYILTAADYLDFQPLLIYNQETI